MKIAQRAAALVVCVGLATACSGPGGPGSATAGTGTGTTTGTATGPGATASTSANPLPEAGPSPAQRVDSSPRWKRVRSAPLTGASRLVDVVATGPGAAWAVGFADGAEDDEGVTVMQRWNGRSWKEVPLPALSGSGGFDATGPDDLWFAGGGEVSHWNGRRWTTRHPFGISDDKHFSDVSVDDGRAVLIGSGQSRSFIVAGENGRFELQIPGREGAFNAVTARAGHAWVVGAKSRESCAGVTPMVLHSRAKDSTWEEMRLPDLPGGSLRAVVQISPTDVWAVGEIVQGGGEPYEADRSCPESYQRPEEQVTTPLAVHWDGRAWRRMELPLASGRLTSVTAFGPDDVWAAGHEAAFLHFDGRKWSAESASGTGTVKAVAAIPGTKDLWAVGAIDEWTDQGQDFVLRRDGRGPRG
ncbi:hypothetical protein AB0G06_23265 [Nonomuraea dietziae]|uniref:hypothetical protein n=1 Tax=Nonomuraea dietziae TaxID=65515 RepID=UPI0033F26690